MKNDSRSELRQKVAIYIRVSTQFQIDKDSLQVQRRELAAYSEYVLKITDYEIFEDPGYSAKNTERPAYQAMMERLRTGEFSHLLVWKIDRISRNLLDFFEMYSELKKIGVAFVSQNEQFDTSNAIGEAMLKIILVFAELERQMTAERVTAVMLSRANNGQWNGGRIPFGYDWDKDKQVFTVNQREAKIYHQICDLYEDKQSLIQVCRTLNDKGVRTKTGGLWNATGVRKLLTNVFYLGTYRYNVHSDGRGIAVNTPDEWIDIKDHHPALIDEARFERFAFVLERNRKNFAHQNVTHTGKNVHIFAGLVWCGICGANMTATQDKRRADGWRPSIYGCRTRRRSAEKCSNLYVNDAAIAPFIMCVLSGILTAKDKKNVTDSPEALEKHLLKHKTMIFVKHISGLEDLIDNLRSGITGLEYSPSATTTKHSDDPEINQLRSRRIRNENAMQRLQSLFLYGEDGMSEKDFVIERNNIQNELIAIDKRLSELAGQNLPITDDSFEDKAGYFLMIQKLLAFQDDSAVKLIRSVDPVILKSFFNRVINRIVIINSKITEIEFNNHIILTFLYK